MRIVNGEEQDIRRMPVDRNTVVRDCRDPPRLVLIDPRADPFQRPGRIDLKHAEPGLLVSEVPGKPVVGDHQSAVADGGTHNPTVREPLMEMLIDQPWSARIVDVDHKGRRPRRPSACSRDSP